MSCIFLQRRQQGSSCADLPQAQDLSVQLVHVAAVLLHLFAGCLDLLLDVGGLFLQLKRRFRAHQS
jgi:hypothetical protein